LATEPSERGNRPWVPLPPQSWKGPARTLPLAAVDRDEQPGLTVPAVLMQGTMALLEAIESAAAA
jgi:hypothetical protein